MERTSTGSTYLQVVILIAFALFVVAPLAYVVIRDLCRTIRQEHLADKLTRTVNNDEEGV